MMEVTIRFALPPALLSAIILGLAALATMA